MLKITRSAPRKSYLVIICPNSHEKLTKSKINQVEVMPFELAQNHSSSLYEVISGNYWPQFAGRQEKLTKYETGCHYLILIGFIYPYLAPKYHFGPYLALFTYS